MNTLKKILSAKLYPLTRTREARWFIKVRFESGHTQKVAGRMNSLKTVEEKVAEAKRIMRNLHKVSRTVRRQELRLIENLSELLERRRPALELKSYQTYFSLLKLFAAWYRPAHKKNRKLKPEAFIQHLYTAGYKPNYITKFGVVFKNFFNTLVKEKLYPCNPFSEFKRRKVKGESKLPFSKAQAAALGKLIREKDKQLWFACEFSYYMFTRPKETRLIKIGDILIDDGKVSIRGDIAKNDTTALITIPAPFAAELRKWITGHPSHHYLFGRDGKPGEKKLAINNLSARHLAVIRPLNWGKRYTFYSWVHTGIKMAAMAGVPLKQLQLQKRHKSLDMFNEYMKDLGVEDCTQLQQLFPAL